MAAYVLGIDPSLTATGVARITQDGKVATAHFGRKGRRGETLSERASRIAQITVDVALWARWTTFSTPELLVIEGMSYGSRGGSVQDRAHLWWLLVEMAVAPHDEVPVVEVAPAQRARWAASSGRADKAAVAAAMVRLWPGYEPCCENCFDALALASIAAHKLGWLTATTKARDEVLARIAWPEGVAA